MRPNQNKINFAEKHLLFLNETPPAAPATARETNKSEETPPAKKQPDPTVEAAKAEAEKQDSAQAKALEQKITESDTLQALGYSPKKNMPQDLSYLEAQPKNAEDRKKFQDSYLQHTQTIFENYKENQPEQYKKMEDLFGQIESALGIPVDREKFEAKMCEIMALYAKESTKRSWSPADMERVARLSREGTFSKWFSKSPNDLLESLDAIRGKFVSDESTGDMHQGYEKSTEIKILKGIQELNAEQKENLHKSLTKMGFIQDDKLQPEILEYLLAGNNLIEDATLVGIAEKWDTMKPKFAQLEGFLGQKIDEKASLESIKQLSKENLVSFEKKSKGIMQASELLQKLPKNESIKEKILQKLNIQSNDSAINLVTLIQNLPETTIQSLESLDDSMDKLNKIETSLKSTFERLGAKFPSSINQLCDENLVGIALDTPAQLESAILTKLVETLSVVPGMEYLAQKEFSNLGEFLTDIEQGMAKFEAELDTLLITLFTGGLQIKNTVINFPAAEFQKILPQLKAQLIPIISEALARQTGTPLLDQQGILTLKQLTTVIQTDGEIKNLLDFCRSIAGKSETEIQNFLQDQNNKDLVDTAGKFFGKIFDTVMNSENPNIRKIRKDIMQIAPPELTEALTGGMLESIFHDLEEAFNQKGIWGIFAALFGLFGKLGDKFDLLIAWGKAKIKPYTDELAEKLKTISPETASKINAWTDEKPEVANPTDTLKSWLKTDTLKFTAEDTGKLENAQDLKMENLLGEKADLAALKTTYGFSEAIDLSKLVETIRQENKYDQVNDSKKSVWEFLLARENQKATATPPAQSTNT